MDGTYTVVVNNGVASVYINGGVEILGDYYTAFANLLSRLKKEKKEAGYKRDIWGVMSNCKWNLWPKTKEIRDGVPSVYIIGVPHLGIIKVGRSEAARRRVRQHIDYTDKNLVVLGVLECPDCWHMAWMEAALHHHLEPHRVPYENQVEWFDWQAAVRYLSENSLADI